MKLSDKKGIVIVLCAMTILVLAFIFNITLALSSLQKLHVDSRVSQLKLVGKDLKQNIEKGLGFGKKLKKFVGMEKKLAETRNHMRAMSKIQDLDISIVLKDQSIPFYTAQNPPQSRTFLTDAGQDLLQAASKKRLPEPWHFKSDDDYFLIIPIWDSFQQQPAIILIRFASAETKDLIVQMLKQNIRLVFLILVGCFLLLLLLLRFSTPQEIGIYNFPKKRIFTIVFISILLGHIIFSAVNLKLFKEYYLQITRTKAATLSTIIKEDIEFLLEKGLTIDKLYKMEESLQEIVRLNPEFNSIFIFDKNLKPLFMGSQVSRVNFTTDPDQAQIGLEHIIKIVPEYNTTTSIGHNNEPQGYITTNIDRKSLMQKGYSLLLDSGTILAITIFFIVELLILMIFYIQGRLTESAGLVRSHLGAVRPAAFLFLFGVDVSKAFLPLYMQQIYEPLLGLSREIVIALPISAELLSTALGFFVAGAWIDKRGWHEPLVFGLFLGVIGQIYSWLALDPVNLILARTLVGLGYGFIAMACQGYVLKFADESNKAQGLSGLGAGIIAGSICGGAAGAMLAERIGFSSVFLCGVVPIVCVFFYFLIFLRPAIGLSGTKKQEERPQPTNPRQIFQFIGNKHVLMLLLCINFPIAIAIVGLLDYFVPVYLNRMGISESNIGRILMLYGICLIYLAPLISRSVDKSERKQDYIIVQGLLGGLTFVVFYFLGGLPAIILAVIILGLSDSLNDASLSYMLNLKISRAIGQSKALGLFNTIIRGGQLLGPLVFGGLIATANIEYSVAVFGFLLVLLSIIYVLFSLLAKSK